MDARDKPGHDGDSLTQPPFIFRPYTPADEDAAIALWLRTWTEAYPDIDFAQRAAAWRLRWRNELAPSARITLAERDDRLAGFVTVDATGYLDQLVVDPGWGKFLSLDPAHSWEVLARFDELAARLAPIPVAVGSSRKGFYGVPLAERDPVSQLSALVAAGKGAALIRTHNVRMAAQFLDAAERMALPLPARRAYA